MTSSSSRQYYNTETGEILGDIYNNPAVFQDEIDTIFNRCWVYVAHESEIGNAGDYKTTFIGSQPVIVARSMSGDEIHVLYNRCRHRAATVCQHEYGNSKFFRCAYHGWTYSNEGKLIGVPFQDGYGNSFDPSQHGLVHVARVEQYKGFIFASVSEDVPTLEEYLGHAKAYLDKVSEMGGSGFEITAGVQKYEYGGNWKLQVENSIDPYHFSIVHRSYLEIISKRNKENGKPTSNGARKLRVIDLGNGHSLAERDMDGDTASIGDLPFILIVFPNLAFLGMQIRVIHPISANQTEVFVYPMMLKNVPKEINANRLRGHEEFYGPAGYGTVDDVEVSFQRVHQGLKAKADDRLLVSRGISAEPDEKGIRTADSTGELSMQSFYIKWQSMFNEL